MGQPLCVFVPCGEYLSVGKTPSPFEYFWYYYCYYQACFIPLLFAFSIMLCLPMVFAFFPSLPEEVAGGRQVTSFEFHFLLGLNHHSCVC